MKKYKIKINESNYIINSKIPLLHNNEIKTFLSKNLKIFYCAVPNLNR